MASVVGICNVAIIRCGNTNTIAALTENTKSARLCNAVYEEARDSLLRSHPWNFAVKRATLAQTTDTPPFEFDYCYGIPDDCLKIQAVDCGEYAFRVENSGTAKVIVTNSDEVLLEYIARVTDPNLMDPAFRQALSATIAMQIATALTDNASLYKVLVDEARELASIARNVDAQEGTPRDPETDLYVRARI